MDIQEPEPVKINIEEIEWQTEHEKILTDWADKAMCYRWLHNSANEKYRILNAWYTIPVIILSTLTGTANFAQDRVPIDYQHLFVMSVGSLNILAGIVTTISQFLKISELNESHRVSSIAWDKFYRNIKIELAKSKKERVPVGQMLKLCKEEFDRLMETCPAIDPKIVNKFKVAFKDTSEFKLIAKPEICDELVPTSSFTFKDKEVKDATPFKQILNKQREYIAQKAKVNQFITTFNETHGRKPLDDEIIENMSEENIDSNRVNSIIIEINNPTATEKKS